MELGQSQRRRRDSTLLVEIFSAVAKNAKAGQTNVQFNSALTGGSIESHSLEDAHDQAQEAHNDKAPREGSQAREEAREAKPQGGQWGGSGKRILVGISKHVPDTLARFGLRSATPGRN